VRGEGRTLQLRNGWGEMSQNGPASRDNRGICRRGLHAHRVLLPAMPRDKAAAYELAAANLDGAHTCSAFGALALR